MYLLHLSDQKMIQSKQDMEINEFSELFVQVSNRTSIT